MKKRKIFWSVAIIAASITLGCTQVLDPVTGEQATVISPESVEVIDTVAGAAPSLAALLALFFPVLLPASTLLVGAAGAWVGMKPKVTAATNEAGIYHAATESIVQVLEQWKTENPEAWVTLKDKLGDNIGDNTEAVIRALRGLPPKD